MNTQETEVMLPTFTVLERAVLYARVSGDDTIHEGRNIKSQLEMGREYAIEKGYRIVSERYEDPKKHTSGYEIDLPELCRIREMARNREFDVLVVRELDRLSRNLAKQLIVEEELNRAGVRVEYVLAEYDDTPEGRLQKHIRATVAEYEREKVKERMARGRQNSIKQGNVLVYGRVPYGYKKVKENGKIWLEIVEEEAQIIRLIFKWFVFGDESGKQLAAYAISIRLSEMGILTREDNFANGKKKIKRGQWAGSSINAILHNETYAGVWRHGKKSSTPLVLKVPAIIPHEWWEEAQERFAINKQTASRNLKYEYLVGKYSLCGCCGYKLTSCSRLGKKKDTIYPYYRCPTKFRHDYYRECSLPFFRADLVDKAIWEWIESIMKDPVALRQGLIQYQEEAEEACRPIRERLEVIDVLLQRHKKELQDELKNLKLVSSKRAKAVIAQDIEQIEATIDSLEANKVDLTKQLEIQLPTEEQIQDIESLAAEVAANLDEFREDFESRRRLITMFNIRTTFKMEDNQRIIYVKGKIGFKILSIVCKFAYVDVN